MVMVEFKKETEANSDSVQNESNSRAKVVHNIFATSRVK